MSEGRNVKIHTLVTAFILAVAVTNPTFAQPPVVRVADNPESNELHFIVGPVSLPASAGHGHGHADAGRTLIDSVRMPFDASLYGFSYEVMDTSGRSLPTEMLHHLNLIDPEHRELFLPISQRLVAVGKETGAQSMPWLLFGYPVRAGQRIVVSTMFHNPTGEDHDGVIVLFRFQYVKKGRPWPLFRVYPFQIDVAFPAGDKDFDLPPGPYSHSYEGSPVLPGRIMVIGSHMHEYAESISLEDVTDDEVLWTGYPVKNPQGNLQGVTIGNLYWKLGAKIVPEHVYRVSITYNNPTPDTLYSGGMGVVAGVFMPAVETEWPLAEPNDPLYLLDRLHYLRQVSGRMDEIERELQGEAESMPMHHHDHHN